jgi:molybdopterin synthase catalytic subunit
MIAVRVQAEPFDLASEATALTARRTDIGALVTFTGLVRDHALTLEHYPGMTERQLRNVADEAATRWPILGGTVIHRFGDLAPGDPIVLVAVVASHRAAAFDAASFLMDWLKIRAPFWKRAGDTWVEAKSSDEDAAACWERLPKPA